MRTCSAVTACVIALLHLVACGRGEPPPATAAPAMAKAEPPVAAAKAAERPLTRPPVQPATPKAAQTSAVPVNAAQAPEAKAATQPPEPATPPPPAVRTKAAPPAGPKPPGIVVFPTSFGKVTFDHPGHGKRNACTACHKTGPPTKIALTKDSAHALCKGCHEQKTAGPTKCTVCHIK